MLCRWKYSSSQRLDDSPSKIGNTIKTGEFLSARQKSQFSGSSTEECKFSSFPMILDEKQGVTCY